MLSKTYRLPSYEIPSVLKRGKRITEDSLVIVYQKNSLEHSRFAFVVPTTIDKRATVRNRMKRLLRETVRLLLPAIATPHDGALLVRSKFDTRTITEVKTCVKTLFQKANLFAGQYEIRNS